MAQFIRFGKKGINLDQMICWEDTVVRGIDQQYVPCLSITFAASEDVADNIQGVMRREYFDGERLALLTFLETQSQGLIIHDPPSTAPPEYIPDKIVQSPSTEDIPF